MLCRHSEEVKTVGFTVVGVRFKVAGKIYYFDPGAEQLAPGDGVIVETVRGVEYGKVVSGPMEVADDEVVAPLKKVIRKATEADCRQLAANREKESRAFQICLEKIAAHNLPMKLVGVEQTFDGNKIIFYFTADGRIDFRELVKDLASVFRTRIELRQIGVRDEAKMMGGLGCCGRELCCTTWLCDFASVSIRMAKDQNLSLNPTKISGICGRLMCCLKYENESYEQAREDFPDPGSCVITPNGEGKVTGINIFKKTVSVELKESKTVKEYSCEEVALKNGQRQKKECPCNQS
ncbi:MAG: stage 0 sporulation family protein [Peptococcaceae bacterium]|nr:stage 0 sporulation family protein [Peptococcaceae bacterium]